MIIPLHNTHILSKITRNYPIVCILRRTRARTAETVFLEKNAEVPILAVTDRENVDIIGPPDPISNLRPIIRKRLLHETTLQRKLRHLQDDTQAWNQNFWTEHNTKFVEQRQSFVKTYLGKIGENRTLTADEMSEFYKKFLDENWRCHFRKCREKFLAGPKYVGPYQPAAHLRRPSILYAYLPAMSSNIRLFDELGNNSKSNYISRENYTSLVFETRYPMKRSWKSAYTLQYSVPSYTYLNSNGSHYSLIMKVVDHVILDAVIENVEVKILLPEGSEIVDIKHPAVWERQGIKFLQDNLANSKPTIVLTANYLSDDDLVDFNVVYKRSMIHLFRPVLYVSVYIETVFLVCIFFRRVKF